MLGASVKASGHGSPARPLLGPGRGPVQVDHDDRFRVCLVQSGKLDLCPGRKRRSGAVRLLLSVFSASG